MIDGLVPFDAADVVFANVQTGKLENRITSKGDAETLRLYDKHGCASEMIAGVALARKLSIWRPSDIVGKQEWEASEICNDLQQDHGFGEPVVLTCGSATSISARFSFLRGFRKSDFSERDLFVLSLLQPHFCTALRLAKDRLEGSIYQEMFQLTTRPATLCDSSGKIMRMNEAARRLVDDGDGKDKGCLAELEAATQDMVAKGLPLVSAVIGGQMCRLSMSPVTSQHAPTTYILLIDTAEYTRSILCPLMRGSDLSKREVEVCMMVVQGVSNQEIADKLFIAECTVKDHVTSIFEKLGVTRRSAVVPRLLGL